MIPLYFITNIYLLLSALILLYNTYRKTLAFILDLRFLILNEKWVKLLFIISGFVLFILKLIFPIFPGPIVLGDLLPASTCLFLSFYYILLTKDNADLNYLYLKGERRGYTVLAIVLAHIFYPSCIIL